MTRLDPAVFELFREEVRGHAAALSAGLVDLEADPANPRRIEPLMRAAHSVKGAARIAGVEPAVRLAHAMEDALVAAQAGRVRITPADIDQLLQAADTLAGLGGLPDTGAIAAWADANAAVVDQLEPVLQALAAGRATHSPRLAGGVVGSPPQTGDRTQDARQAGGYVKHDGAGGTSSSPDFPPIPPHDPVPIPSEPLALADDAGMLGLFREEVRTHLLVVSAGLDALDVGSAPGNDLFDSLRQLRGSALIMKCPSVAAAVGAAAQFVSGSVPPAALGWLRYLVHTLAGVIGTDDETFPGWVEASAAPLDQIAAVLRAAPTVPVSPVVVPPPPPPAPDPQPVSAPVALAVPAAEGVVRVTAQSLNRLMGLAGESLVQARWLHLFSNALLKLRKQHEHLAGLLDGAVHAAAGGQSPDRVALLVAEARQHAAVCREELTGQSADFDDHSARAEDLNSRLYREVIASRMRPFADGVHGLSRMVRDVARALGKQARLVVEGEGTEVDRDVLEKLESPLTHLIRNAVDHGIEPPADRVAAGKPEAGTVRVDARHRAGLLSVTVEDDGRGVDLDRLRRKVAERGLSSPELVRQMSEAELLEFLFLPGFTTTPGVTEFSGRGVGLDVVQQTVRQVGGSVRVSTAPGRRTAFHLHLPVTLSVIRAVVVEVGGEPYAFPHTRIDRLLDVPRAAVRSVERRQFVAVDGQNVGLVLAGQLLDVPARPPAGPDLPVVLLSDAAGSYGLVVDSFRGEQDLVVRPLDPRLGKVPNLSAAAVLDDGEPVLIVDVEDLVRSMDQFIQTGSLRRCEVREAGPARRKRVLVVDDSITVREVERQLLLHAGYEVAVAVDGMDGWNQVRAARYDLLVTDVDMPRMSGIQLVQAVRGDDKLKHLPVVIVSYKEREEDRLKGLDVGANYYLTKSSFHDNRFVRAVEDLIGAAE